MPRKFVRVKDTDTKHEFDVPEGDRRIASGAFELIKSDRYPPVDRPRRAKFHVQVQAKRSAGSAESPKENTNG